MEFVIFLTENKMTNKGKCVIISYIKLNNISLKNCKHYTITASRLSFSDGTALLCAGFREGGKGFLGAIQIHV